MKPLIYAKFGMINRSMEVVFCLYEKYEKLLFCVTLVKRSITSIFASGSIENDLRSKTEDPLENEDPLEQTTVV